MSSLPKSATFPLFILMLNLFIALLGQGMVIPILPEYLKQFNAAGAAAGYLIAAFGAAQFIFSPLGGQLSDRWGRKSMIITGLFLTVISDLMFAVSTTLPLLYIARFIGGIGIGLMVPSNMAYVADITTSETRAKGMGYLGASMNLGMVLGPGLGGMIAEFGIRVPYFFAGGLGLVATLLSLYMPETLPKEKRKPASQWVRREPIRNQILNSFRTSYFRYLLLILIMTLGLMNYETVYALFVERKYGFDATKISMIITVGAIIGIVVQIWLLDYLIKRLGEMKLIRLSLIMTAIALLLMIIKINLGYLLAVSALFFAFNAFLRPTVSTMIANSAGDRQGYAAGLNTTYTSLGNILGPILAGLMFDKHIHIPYIFGALILASALFLTLQKSKNEKRMVVND
ncbi:MULTISPECIES: MFS transporter [Paenibacillus]|jgi:DHA1 family multidrug resistance protein-like MFS transporter|uniref:MFS transporter n=2 Tax=Paenibacillus TaxID=44249 RepID=A0AAJ3MHC9_PAEPO|nr:MULTISPECIES: MFS transporter [Paenibacillus]MBP1174929.1 DHA1 family multidrug resistance protein-like MFS transporter [Paenibacillus sp. PvR133]MCP3744145.1 MFS transporter [Paenibacillus sp. A3M_27_13]MDH2330416.1 MFS transporter [Paenibacillus polymyxa]MDR6777398.1 DHA1 family multidrug resistance protein-like MFS transporter [Paenibacillus peoriae]ODA11003.1 multidrug transporter [Paenibacillus polymyxa]